MSANADALNGRRAVHFKTLYYEALQREERVRALRDEFRSRGRTQLVETGESVAAMIDAALQVEPHRDAVGFGWREGVLRAHDRFRCPDCQRIANSDEGWTA